MESQTPKIRKLVQDQALIYKPPKYEFPNLEGNALSALVDQDEDGTETYHFGEHRLECDKCDRWTWHDIYVEVEGLVDIKARTTAHCRDCGEDQKGTVESGIGTIKPVRLARVVEATARASKAARVRAKNSRRRNR